MIGKKEWFTSRRYTGFGLRPKTWQGWVYILVVLAVIIFIQTQNFWIWNFQTKMVLILGLIALIVSDSIHVWISLKKK